MYQTCLYCLGESSIPIRGAYNVVTTSLHATERYVLNDKGVVGSLYDARTDNLLSSLPIPGYLISKNSVTSDPICKLKRIDKSNPGNLLELIDIQPDLRVSIILNKVQVTQGTLMLYNYDLPTGRTIRLIHYYHVNQEERLSNDIQSVQRNLPDSLPDNDATHIITSVRRGIDFVIVIELPDNANVNEIDLVLEKICTYFRTPQTTFLSGEDRQKIIGLHSTVFTSMTDMQSFVKNKDLIDLCPYIHGCIYQSRNDFPLSYKMHLLKCIFSDKLPNGRNYSAIDTYIIKKIEEKILPLSKKLKQISYFYEKMLSQPSQGDNSLIKELKEDLCKMKKVYVQAEKDLTTTVDKLRSGKRDLDLLREEPMSTKLEVLNSQLIILRNKLSDCEKTRCSITKPKTDNQTKCLNGASLNGSNDDPQTQYSTSHKFNSTTIPGSTSSIIKPNEINILLVGETGVGKSTFINAFVNYLAFHSLDEAKTNDPIVLIPVSFIITTGDHFEEQKIQFGQLDPNEDHNHPGQSVTQYCKSYIFTIGNNIKLRIIDTPGIGDTRGTEQDNNNIEHILLYTSNLPYLNAICFLLKPNATRLHALFRSSFTQLFDFLGPNARDNIIFCFTNTRATFYTPGDTSRILQKMLNDLPNDHKPSFSKENTFCFDSESFRYLAVLKAGHQLVFDNSHKEDFERSWKMSVTESVRLLKYLEYRPQYEMNRWHSTKHAQMMITLLTRPIVETIRNALRNSILWELGDKQHTIEMKAEHISLPAWICTRCVYNTEQIGNISIVTHPIHNYRRSNECNKCHHMLDEHISVLCKMECHLGKTQGKRFLEEIEYRKNRLREGSIIMTQFLCHTVDRPQNPFLVWFNYFIEGEKILCQKDTSNNFNNVLCKRLEEEKTKYVDRLDDNDLFSLEEVYNCIEEILRYREVSEQIKTIKENYMEMMKNNEYDVSSTYPCMKTTGLLSRSINNTNWYLITRKNEF